MAKWQWDGTHGLVAAPFPAWSFQNAISAGVICDNRKRMAQTLLRSADGVVGTNGPNGGRNRWQDPENVEADRCKYTHVYKPKTTASRTVPTKIGLTV